MWKLRHILQDAEGGEDAAAGGDVVDTPAADSGAPPAATDDKGGAAPAKSALAAGADVDDADPETPPTVGEDGRPDWCPEKYWNPEAKAPDTEKLGKGYAELVKLLGNVAERPPKDIAGYKIELAEGEEFSVDEAQDAEFREEALKEGLNNRQYNWVLRMHSAGIDAALTDHIANNEARTLEALEKEHGSPQAVKGIQRAAFKAFARFATETEMASIATMPTTPALLNVLARVGRAMTEDTSPGNGNGASSWDAQTNEALRLIKDHGKDGAYWNEHHPDHVNAVRKVEAWRAQCVAKGIDSVALQREGRA